MAEKVQYTGRLGLEARDTGTLSAAVSAVVDTLEDFGHPAETIEARAENTAKIQCDHYLVTVRLRRVPLRRASRLTNAMLQPAALLELSLTPAFPDYCDQEISELFLAEMLRRLLPAVEATSVEWLESDVALTCEQFLSVFEPNPENSLQATPEPAETRREHPAPVRLRGRACFTPVDQAALALDAHCDQAFQAVRLTQSEPEEIQKADLAQARARKPEQAQGPYRGWAHQLRSTAIAAFSIAGTRRLRFISHLMLLTALLLYMESAGMVQAARPLVP
ncbi:hypothetical protein [Leisingera sp. NJS204]|uniref:hypothetical protein n=1 Tax=Leisingera sp. NJS204 TaxID=2508307 RepID=UPI001010263C|nr:hypothetical protein [Leisingera sp. NJS204]QAX29804.1 hypothetical protein ETW24_10720 [Leisingera sp. NJS204]